MSQSLQGLCMSCITCVACSTQAAAWLSVCMPLLPHIVFVFISFFHFPKLHSIRGGWLAGYWYQRNHLINVTNRFLTGINNQDVEESYTSQPANWLTKLNGNISYRYQQPRCWGIINQSTSKLANKIKWKYFLQISTAKLANKIKWDMFAAGSVQQQDSWLGFKL